VAKPKRVTYPRPAPAKPVAPPPVPVAATVKHEEEEAALQKLFEHPDAYGVVTQAAGTPPVKTDLAAFLASPDGLRQAIILREVFGPPRSLQPLTDPAFSA
jgi:hypothetical protein